MTDLNLTLSSALQNTLQQTGNSGHVNAYAVYFTDNGATANWTEIAQQSVLNSNFSDGSHSISLPEPFSSGKVYLLTQSAFTEENGSNPENKDLQDVITQESDITLGNAATYNYRFDSVEMTLQNTATDQGNLTSVTNFGMTMEMAVTYDDGTTATRGYNVSGGELYDLLDLINTGVVTNYSGGPLGGDPREAVAPAGEISSANPDGSSATFGPSDWNSYVASLQSVTDIEIAGYFNGAPDAGGSWHNAGYFSYKLEYDSTDQTFWLNPTDSSEIKGHIHFDGSGESTIQDNIYSTIGTVDIYTNRSDTDAFIDDMGAGANNQWGTVLTNLFTGFSAGYYTLTGQPENAAAGTVNLNQSWNWDPTYAFAEQISGSVGADHFMDPYANTFFETSNSYGSNYTDNLTAAYTASDGGGPLIGLSNSDGQNVSTIDLTLFDDSDAATEEVLEEGSLVSIPLHGYTEWDLTNYIAPTGTDYESLAGATSTINATFNLGSQRSIVDSGDVKVSFGVYSGGSMQELELTTTDNSFGLFQNWQVTETNGTFSIIPTNVEQTTAPAINITFPTASSGVSWYTFKVESTADSSDSKTYNIYTTGAGSNVVSAETGELGIDGLAGIKLPDTAGDTTGTFTVDLFDGLFSLPSEVLTEVNASTTLGTTIIGNYTTPNAPVLGSTSSGTFTLASGNSITVAGDTADLAFGWTGAGSTTAQGGYTNKIGAENYAVVEIFDSSSNLVGSVNGQADIDGEWFTDNLAFTSSGTYTAKMTEYDDAAFTEQVGKESTALSFSLDLTGTLLL